MEWRLNHVGQMAQSVQDYSISISLIKRFEFLTIHKTLLGVIQAGIDKS